MSEWDVVHIIPEDAGTIEIPETPSLREIKKDLPLPDPVQTICSKRGAKLPPLETVADDPDGAEIPEVVQDDPEGVEPLLVELMDDILGRLPMLQVLQLRPQLGSALRNAIHRPAFLLNRPSSEGEFGPMYFMTDAIGDLHWHGFDTKLRTWRRLPSLNFAPKILPSRDPDLFKDYLMAGDGGLLCVNVRKFTGREKLVICNPLTQTAKVLPCLINARHPLLMHLKVDPDSGHYQVVVAGSAASGTEELSLKTEVYDSKIDVWECPDGSDLPCPPYGLNEYQNGACIKEDGKRELLLCVASVDRRRRGLLAYDIVKKRWVQGLKDVVIPLVDHPNVTSQITATQIVECGGFVFVYSKQECESDVYFVIHKVILKDSGFKWEEVMNCKTTMGHGLAVYPEVACVPVSDNEFCFVNIADRVMEIIAIEKPMDGTPVVEAPTVEGHRLCIPRPPGFSFKIGFKSHPCPGRCGPEREEYCSKCQRTCSDSVASGSDIIDPAIIAPAQETDIISDDDILVNALRRDGEIFEAIFDLVAELDRVQH